jgi:hypothetical protein
MQNMFRVGDIICHKINPDYHYLVLGTMNGNVRHALRSGREFTWHNGLYLSDWVAIPDPGEGTYLHGSGEKRYEGDEI